MRARPRFYRLEGRFAVPSSLDQFAQDAMTPKSWAVSHTRVGRTRVSTVFLGLDCRPAMQEGDPLTFETMIFGGPHHLSQYRYETWAEAEAGHDRIVAALRLARAEALDVILAARREARACST